MSEPFYIRQSGDTRTSDEAREWFRECTAEAKAEGAQLCRYSQHPDDKHLFLVECWREKHVKDQGPLRWNLTYAQDEVAHRPIGEMGK